MKLHKYFRGVYLGFNKSWHYWNCLCYRQGHLTRGSHMSRCVSIANMQPPNLYVSKFSRITDFQTIRKRALYRSMPAIRSAKHLCPVCLKGYNTDFWLNKHIDLDHPRYRHQLELAAKKQSKSSFSARSSFQLREAIAPYGKDIQQLRAFHLMRITMPSMTRMHYLPPPNCLTVIKARICWNLTHQTPRWLLRHTLRPAPGHQ